MLLELFRSNPASSISIKWATNNQIILKYFKKLEYYFIQ